MVSDTYTLQKIKEIRVYYNLAMVVVIMMVVVSACKCQMVSNYGA
jgi:hypothetical protein